MSQDRRRHPRFPALLHCALVFARERREMFCTQVGPAAGFIAGRSDGLQPGMVVSVDMRAGGVGTVAVLLQGEVVRVVAAGGSWPAGIVVRWKSVSCELGVGPLLDFVSQVLHVRNVAHTDVAAGRQAELDLEGFVEGRPVRVRSAGRSADVYMTDVRPQSAAPARQAARSSQLVPSAGLLSALAGSKAHLSPSNIGATISRGAQPMARDEDCGQLEPIVVREISQVIDARRRGATNPRMINVLPAHHAGGPALDGVDRSTASAVADELPPRGLGHAAQSDSHRSPAATQTAAYGAAAPGPTPAQASTPPRPTLPPGAPPFAALGPNLLSPMRSARQSGGMEPEPVLPRPNPPDGPGSPPAPSEPSSSFDWPPGKVQPPPDALAGFVRSDEPESIAIDKPVAPPRVVATRHALNGAHYANEMSHVAGAPLTPPVHIPDDGLSRSWPVYALAPGERRTDPEEEGLGVPELAGLGSDIDLSGEPTETNPKAPVTDNLGARPVERPNLAVMRRRGPARSETRHMVAATIPVSYEHGGRLGRGMVIAISPEAAAVVTNDVAPQLDEPVVLHLPLADQTGPVIVHLCGKLLQITTETDQGPRFVLHIERVEEGQSKGAFFRALDQLARA
ncbi:MAG: hypothetical protein FJ100_17245 [Deltaproteobacteria bacterium]|nr:hypothetical protein [Deltaproteobacteria bacterium]